jgi:type IV pilus assembly protein PilE
MEVVLVLTVMGILISMAAPSFRRSMEQSRADIAGANLRAIWGAERLYWLENRTYTNDLSELESLGLLDPTIVAASTRYVYAIPSADASTFTATATRTGSTRWTGQFSIDEDGVLSGVIQASGQPNIVPGFQ